MTTVSADLNHPYASAIEQFFAERFPGVNTSTNTANLDAITNAIIGSGQIRYGAHPSPEGLVAIHSVVRTSLEHDQPIPIVVPFGSRKTILSEPLDVAEVAALKQLTGLQERVSKYHKKGIQVNIRIEDLSGNYLFAKDGEESRVAVKIYTTNLVNLICALDLKFIKPLPESSLCSEGHYLNACNLFFPHMRDYLLVTHGLLGPSWMHTSPYETIVKMGWKGTIPLSQRNYYFDRYKALEPDISLNEQIDKLAKYFTSSWARYKTGISGADTQWTSYISLTFCPPVPGTPTGMFDRYVYYRTLPLCFAQTHMPPWRCKGYLKLNGSVMPKLASWKDDKPFQKSKLIFSGAGHNVPVQADYLIE